MKSTVLVTGGAGFIGSHAAKRLRDEGHKVIVLDNLSVGSLSRVPKGVTFVRGDVGDQTLVSQLIRTHGITAVMHFAAFIKVEESMLPGGKEKYIHNNTEEAERLMRTAAHSGVEHFIFSSTAAVYGNPDISPVPESALLKPINNYGLSKVLAESALRATSDSTSMRHVILRYFNVAGADPEGECGYSLDEKATHLIRVALEVARGKRDHLKVYGMDYPTPDNTCIRDYIHVMDLVEAHVQALWYLESGGSSDIFNVGYGEGFSVLEVHAAVEAVVGTKVYFRHAPRREGDPATIIADSRRLRDALGWQPRYDDLYLMIEHQWKWELSQEPALT